MSIDLDEQRLLPRMEDLKTETKLYTIGYEGFEILNFVHLLRIRRIERVIDVRRNPISRKRGFSKRILQETLEKYGIEYFHIPQLGIPTSYRTELNCQADYDRLFDLYEKELLPDVMEFVEQAAKLVQEKTSVLLCFEKSPNQCHRTRLALKIKDLYGYPVIPLK